MTAHLTTQEPESVARHARDVAFDWVRLPMHWIPGEPFATHLINLVHLILPLTDRERADQMVLCASRVAGRVTIDL